MNNVNERWPDLISATEARTLPGLFRERVLRTPRLTAYRQFDRDKGEWRSFSWQQTSDLVARWQRAFARLRLAPGDRVAVQLRNCREWVCYEQAAIALGLVVVPLYPNDRPGVRTRFADKEELLVKSPGLMLGYWKRPQDTRAAIDAEGWLHTGDIAQIRGEHIFIRGRNKEILVMSSGNLKVKREEGERRFAAEIDGLYRSSRANELSKHHQTANPIHSDGGIP